MSIKKEIMGSMRSISVGFYCHTDDKGFEDKIASIEVFLTKNGGDCTIHRKKVSKKGANMLVEFHATIPEWFVRCIMLLIVC